MDDTRPYVALIWNLKIFILVLGSNGVVAMDGILIAQL